MAENSDCPSTLVTKESFVGGGEKLKGSVHEPIYQDNESVSSPKENSPLITITTINDEVMRDNEKLAWNIMKIL